MAQRFAFPLGAISASVLVLSLAACGGGGGGGSATPPVPPPAGDGGIAKILSASSSIKIGNTVIDGTVNMQPVEVDGDVSIPYDPVTVSASGTFSGICGNVPFTGTIKTAVPGTTTFSHPVWPDDVACSGTATFSATGYTSATKTYTWRTKAKVVTPPPPPVVKLSYEGVAVAIWPGHPLGTAVIDRTVAGGSIPNVNLTGKNFYFVGLRATPRADCLVEASALDSITGVEYKLLWNPKTREYTLDTSAAGAALDRFRDYKFTALSADYDPVTNRSITVRVPGGKLFLIDGANENIWFESDQGVVTKVVSSTFVTTGTFVNWLGAYTCTAR